MGGASGIISGFHQTPRSLHHHKDAHPRSGPPQKLRFPTYVEALFGLKDGTLAVYVFSTYGDETGKGVGAGITLDGPPIIEAVENKDKAIVGAGHTGKEPVAMGV